MSSLAGFAQQSVVLDAGRSAAGMSTLGQVSAGSALKGNSFAMAGAGLQPSLAAQMSRVMSAEFGRSSAVLDAMATMAKTSMLGPTESASVLNKLISSAGVQVSITPSTYEVVTSILGEGGSVVSEETCERSSFGPRQGDSGRCRAARGPDLDRAALQVWATLIYRACLAQLQLSENELTKILRAWFTNVGFLAPVYLVWRITGNGYDTLFPPGDPDEDESV